MNRNMIVAGVIVAIVVIGGVWYFMSGGAAGVAVTDSNTTTTTATSGTDTSGQVVKGAGTTSGSSTIGGLIAMGKDLQCNVTISTSGAQTEGMIYVSGGKMRGDFSTIANGNAVNAMIINNGTYVYSWTNLSTKGFKTAVSSTGSAGTGTAGAIDNSSPVKYSCKAWSAVASKFTPPSNITF